MSVYIFWFSCVLLGLYFVPTLSTDCKTDIFYKYVARPLPHGRMFVGCKFFNQPQLLKFTDFATITCSNVPPSVLFNYTYEPQYYDQDLTIVSSEIPNLPSNSSLSRFRTIRQLTLKNLGMRSISPGAFENLETLKSMDLSFNKFKKIPEDVFTNLSKLSVLNLSYNDVESVESESFSGLVLLKKLYLNGNQISVLKNDVFGNLESLEVLDVSDNPLKVFQDVRFKNLKTLLIRNTPLKQFDNDLTKLSLSDCDLSNNSLEIINFNIFPPMKKINLSHNHISSDELLLNSYNIKRFEHFPKNVKELDLSHNKITYLNIDFSHPNLVLTVLNVSYNKIFIIIPGTFSQFQNLKVLSAGHNKIKMLEQNVFVNCSRLKKIDLSYNEISYIQENVFTGSNELEMLDLSHNKLETLTSRMILKGNFLRYLNLDHNQIVDFNVVEFLYNVDKLEKIKLNNNSWSCEALSDIVHWLHVRNVDIADKEPAQENNVGGINCKFNKLS